MRCVLCVLAWAVGGAAVADDTVTVKVVGPDGKPAGAGVKVWVYGYTRNPDLPQVAQSFLVAETNAAGEIAAPARIPDSVSSTSVHARDAAGRLGGATLRFELDGRTPGSVVTVRLVDTADRPGRVVGPDGKPAAGVTIALRGTIPPTNADGGRSGESIGVPAEEKPRYTATTDADGRFMLKGMPVGHQLFYRVSKGGTGETWYDAPGEGDLNFRYAAPGSVRVTAVGIEPAKLKNTSCSIVGDPDTDVTAVRVPTPRRRFSGKHDGQSAFVIPDVAPGRYRLELTQAVTAPAVPQPGEAFEVKPGEPTAVAMKFGPAATIAGRVVGGPDRKPLPKVELSILRQLGPDRGYTYHGVLTTAADGTFTGYGPAGVYVVQIHNLPAGYASPLGRWGDYVKATKVELGDTLRFPDIALTEAVTFAGRVVLSNGKPAAGAKVLDSVGLFDHRGRRNGLPLVTDADGTFTVAGLLPDEMFDLRIQLGKAVNVPVRIEAKKGAEPTVVELSEANATTLAGVVTDGGGKPVAGATVSLQHNIRGIGRFSQSGIGRPFRTVTTKADGRYTFADLWATDSYDVKVKADGFADAEALRQRGEAGKTTEVAPFVLTRASLAVRGIVTTPDGKRLNDVTVFAVDGPARVTARTKPDGTFKLAGFFDTPAWVFAKLDGYRLAAVPVTPGKDEPVTVKLIPVGASPLPAPVVTTEHKAAQEKLLRHLLNKLWEGRVENGYGGSAVRYMAKIDPALARKWAAEEEKRTAGKTKWAYLVAEAERAKTPPTEDADDTIDRLQGVSARTAFYELMALARRHLDDDKPKAARLAEEMVVRARQRELPDKIFAIAEAGELAARAGNRAGGEKVVREAAALAMQLPTAGRDRDTMTRGMTFARLAPFDWPAAKAELDKFKDDGEYNRFLAAAVVQLAPWDLPKAKEALGQFRPSNDFYRYDARVRAARAIARANPDAAIELIDGIAEVRYRIGGYADIADRLKDKDRSVKLIDMAFDLTDANENDFRSWSNFGGRSSAAHLLLHAAAKVGHPDLAGLVARTLSLRPTGADLWTADARADHLVNVAASLALIDPPTARRVLAGVVPPERYVEMAKTKGRDWLFALALADPDRAAPLVDARLKQQHAGLSELASVLTADDRFTDLAGWAGSLMRPNRDSD